MKSCFNIFIYCLMPCALLVACTPTSSDKQAAATAFSESDNSVELPLPIVPADITDKSERAAYLLSHFWDAMDFTDTTRCLKSDFVEQNFSNFISLFQLADVAAQKCAVSTLMNNAAVNPQAYDMMIRTARKYLYEPDSPMLNEPYYEIFVDEALYNPVTFEAQRMRLKTEKSWLDKNTPGSKATDFVYRASDGSVTSLLKTSIDNQLILVFFDPTCDHCHEVISMLGANTILNQNIADGKVRVLAINVVPEETPKDIPDNWQVGTDLSGIERKDLYIIRATPSIYILNSAHTILAKDIPPQSL